MKIVSIKNIYNKKKELIKLYIFIFLSLLLTNFFGAINLNNTILLIIITPFIFIKIYNKSIFKSYIILMFIGLVFSIFSCNYFRGQNLFLTFKTSAPYFYISFYFCLKKFNLSVPAMEKGLLILVIIFCLSYLLQYIIYPTIIFSGANSEYYDTNNLRIRLAAQGFSSLGFFFGINKYLVFDKKKIFYLLLALFCFIIIFLMGFRTLSVSIIFFLIFLNIKINGFRWKIIFNIFIIFCLMLIISNIPVFANKIIAMNERQKTEVLTNSDYIRVIQFEYFTKEHFKSFWEFIFGSGMPALGAEKSKYGKSMQYLLDQGITWVDFGLLSLSWLIGIITVISMFGYSIKAGLLKVHKNYYYLGVWFLYLVTASFTTQEFYRPGNFIVQAIALYIIEKSINHNNSLKKQKK